MQRRQTGVSLIFLIDFRFSDSLLLPVPRQFSVWRYTSFYYRVTQTGPNNSLHFNTVRDTTWLSSDYRRTDPDSEKKTISLNHFLSKSERSKLLNWMLITTIHLNTHSDREEQSPDVMLVLGYLLGPQTTGQPVRWVRIIMVLEWPDVVKATDML